MAAMLASWEPLQESNSTLGCDFLQESSRRGKSYSEDFHGQQAQELDQWDKQIQQERLSQVFQKTTTLKKEASTKPLSAAPGVTALAPPTPTQPTKPVKQFIQINGEMVAVTTTPSGNSPRSSSLLRRGSSVRRSKTFTSASNHGVGGESRGRGLRVKERFRESFRSRSRAPKEKVGDDDVATPQPTTEQATAAPPAASPNRTKRGKLLRRATSYREPRSSPQIHATERVSATEREDDDEVFLKGSSRRDSSRDKPAKSKSMRKKIARGLSKSRSGIGKQISKSKSQVEKGIRSTTKMVLNNTTAVSDYLFTDQTKKITGKATTSSPNSNELSKSSRHHHHTKGRTPRPRRPSGDRAMLMQRSHSMQLQRSTSSHVIGAFDTDQEAFANDHSASHGTIVVPVLDLKNSSSTHGSRKENLTNGSSAAPSKRNHLKQQLLDDGQKSSSSHGSRKDLSAGSSSGVPSRRTSLRKSLSNRKQLDRASSHNTSTAKRRNTVQNLDGLKNLKDAVPATPKRRDEVTVMRERKQREIKQLVNSSGIIHAAAVHSDDQPSRLGTVADRRRNRLSKAASERGFLNTATSSTAASNQLHRFNNDKNTMGSSSCRDNFNRNGEGLNEMVNYLQRKEQEQHPVFTDIPPADESMRTMRTLDTTLALQNGLTNRKVKGCDQSESEASSVLTPARALYPGMKKYLATSSEDDDDDEEEEEESKYTAVRTIDSNVALAPGKEALGGSRAFDFVPVAPTRNNSGMSSVRQ